MARVKQRTLYPTTQFRRDVKKQWAELITPDWVTVIYCLMNGHDIPKKYRDHALSGEWSAFVNVTSSRILLLIYETDEHTVQLVRLGSHSELFG